MAVTRKQDNNNKKDQGKKEAGAKEASKKDLVLKKDNKKDLVKKDAAGKKEVVARKEKIDRIEQARKFFRGALNELKKVHWPNRKEVTIYTSVVLVAVVAVGALIWLFDSVLSSILRLIIVR
ncbi:MAG: preprotein translocase subunit SecE [Firmicutes bacterium]|nr:preprotein translocase subunit SecE [Bacillota bacterium]